MAAIPNGNHHSRRQTASVVSQTQNWTPIGGQFWKPFDTLEHLKLLERQMRAHEGEILSLRAFIAQKIPAPAVDGTGPQGTQLPAPDWGPVRAWLRDLAAGRLALEVDDIGLRVTRKAGPNPRIMPGTVLTIVRSACE